MKSVATFIFSLIIYVIAASQVAQKDSSYKCVAHWKKGEEKVLLIKRMKVKIDSGKPEPAFTFSYEAFITILDSTKNGYKVQWVFHLPDDVKKSTPGLAEAMPVYEGLKMIFVTDRMGAFKELINWLEVKDVYVKMMEISLPKNLDDTAKAAIEKSKELFNSKEMVESALIKEIQLYYSSYGAVFTMAGSSHQASLSNPFSDEPIPAILSEKIIELAPQLDYVKISLDEQIDMEKASKLFEGLFRKMNIVEDSVLIKAKDLLSDLEIKEHDEYLVTQSTGWVRKVSHLRASRAGGISNEDSFIIEIKE